MKKILVIGGAMVVGGLERALISFLKRMMEEPVEFTLLLPTREGALYGDLPQGIAIEEMDPIRKGEQLKRRLSKGQLGRALSLVTGAVGLRLTREDSVRGERLRNYFWNKVLVGSDCTFPSVEEKYDLVIAYRGSDELMVKRLYAYLKGLQCPYAVFIHDDVSDFVPRSRHSVAVYKGAKRVFCVSKGAKEVFDRCYPEAATQSRVFYNLLPTERILQRAKEPLLPVIRDVPAGRLRLATVARLSYEKGQEMIPAIGAALCRAGVDFVWYVAGEGALRQVIESAIAEEVQKLPELEGRIVLTGSLENPYPLIAAADIYVQTSHSEGYCITLAEARLLCRPVATTDFPGAREQITHGVSGLITRDTPEALTATLLELCQDPTLREAFSDYWRTHSVAEGGGAQMSMIMELLPE